MNLRGNRLIHFVAVLALTLLTGITVNAQQKAAVVLAGAELTRVVPTGFYFQGQTAPTQMRNATAARLGENRHVVAGLVDTSGYSADIRAKYEGFLITDSEIEINGETLETGAYGFGFTQDSKLNVFDISGKQILSVNTTSDRVIRRPRPLMLRFERNELRLYSGRDYAVITMK